MAIPETQLDTWSHQGSIEQSRATYASVRTALLSAQTAYAEKKPKVYLQGSYCNDTNIWAESDVDVVIELPSSFYKNLDDLPQPQKDAFKAAHADATYGYSTYKNDVVAQLRAVFGTAAVVPGKKAVKIAPVGNRRSADVLVAIEYRRYSKFVSTADQTFDKGIGFVAAGGTVVSNYPKQHSDNCTTMHQATNSWFKPTVRIFKNMRSRLVDDGVIEAGSAPSYFIEGLLCNVPADNFGGTYEDTFVKSFNWIINADRAQFVCANEQFHLLGDDANIQWSAARCDQFLNGLRDLWTQW